jgi:serine/threonine protein kinase
MRMTMSQVSTLSSKVVAMTKNHFTFLHPIGRGGFGKVWHVESKKGKQAYAMKEMSKARIISKRSVHSVINERDILTNLKDPYSSLPKLLASWSICSMLSKIEKIST